MVCTPFAMAGANHCFSQVSPSRSVYGYDKASILCFRGGAFVLWSGPFPPHTFPPLLCSPETHTAPPILVGLVFSNHTSFSWSPIKPSLIVPPGLLPACVCLLPSHSCVTRPTASESMPTPTDIPLFAFSRSELPSLLGLV